MAESKDSLLRTARKSIQDAIEHQEADRRRKLLTQRLEIARTGVELYKKRKHTEAVKYFQSYVRILEDLKGAKPGELHPSQFDRVKEIQELLLVSGIYWDLTKLYDRTHGPDSRREFLHYMEKYILFSQGLPYQVLCAETMRKYISNEKPVHTKDFKNAYKLMAPGKCFIVTSLVDHVGEDTLPRLWQFRDEGLRPHRAGRALIRVYYFVGPGLAWILDHSPQGVRRRAARVIDSIASRL